MNNINNIEYRLYYAETDKESMVIKNVIMDNALGRIFNRTDVTELSLDQLQMLDMQSIPTIVVSSPNNRPDVYDGPKKCSMFLNNLIMNRRTTQMTETESRMKLIQKAQRDSRLKSEGPSEYSEAEMSGVSDSYAYMQTDMAQAKAYVLVGQEDSTYVITPQVNESKITKKRMETDLNTLENQRKQDLNTFKEGMEQRQIDSVFSNGY
jgi:hypothetical protein